MDVICTVDRLVNALQYLQASKPSSVQRTFPFETVVPRIDFIRSSKEHLIGVTPQINIFHVIMKFINTTQCQFVSFRSNGNDFTASDKYVLNIIDSKRKKTTHKQGSDQYDTYDIDEFVFEEMESLVHTIPTKLVDNDANNKQDLDLRINENGDFIRIQNNTGDWTKFLTDIVAPDARSFGYGSEA